MSKTCKICNTKITNKNNGFSDLLDNNERKRLLKLKKEETVCTECKYLFMAVDIMSPFK